MDDYNFPLVPRPLLERLEKVFKNEVPLFSDTNREVWAKAGEQRVLKLLRDHFNKQNKLSKETP